MKLDFDKMPKTVAIVGSRSFDDSKALRDKFSGIVNDFVSQLSKDTLVVSGKARGIDTYGEKAATKQGLGFKGFPPDRGLPSPARYFARNSEVVEFVRVRNGLVVAFIDISDCDGTMDTLKKAWKKDVETITYSFTPDGNFFGVDGTLDKYVKVW